MATNENENVPAATAAVAAEDAAAAIQSTTTMLGRASVNDDGVRSRMELLNRERLQRIADENPNTTVYEYAPEENAPPAKPMAEVRPLLVQCLHAAATVRHEHPDWADDDEVRREIIRRQPAVQDLFRSHGKIFEFMTSRETERDPQRQMTMWRMIYLREQHEKGAMNETEADYAVSQHLQQAYLPKSAQGNAAPSRRARRNQSRQPMPPMPGGPSAS